MNAMKFFGVMLFVFSLSAAQERTDSAAIRHEILALMEQQVQGWNNGSIEAFMDGYQRSDSLLFASGGSVTYGWKTMLERYTMRYPTREKMGTLVFSNISVIILASDAVAAFGEWKLKRETDTPMGLFTLLLRKTGGQWKIVHDHTSSATEK